MLGGLESRRVSAWLSFRTSQHGSVEWFCFTQPFFTSDLRLLPSAGSAKADECSREEETEKGRRMGRKQSLQELREMGRAVQGEEKAGEGDTQLLKLSLLRT